ncbi:MAG: hypothetical protein KKE89_02830, partial [Actinobacteria bacterium]|nr:hypothetical protein [Actinomycetota bacterium]
EKKSPAAKILIKKVSAIALVVMQVTGSVSSVLSLPSSIRDPQPALPPPTMTVDPGPSPADIPSP